MAKKPKGHWRLFPKHTKSNCAAEARHLGAVPALLAFIETYSPFTEFLQSDEEFLAKVREEKERRDNLEAQKSKVEKDM